MVLGVGQVAQSGLPPGDYHQIPNQLQGAQLVHDR